MSGVAFYGNCSRDWYQGFLKIWKVRPALQGYLAHKKQPLLLRTNIGAYANATVGYYEGGVSYERGTPLVEPLPGLLAIDDTHHP